MSSFPSAFNCPITLVLMSDPVKAPDGHTYERTAIVEALRRNGVSPLTRQPMSVDQLVTDYTLKSAIEDMTETETETETFQPMPRAVVCSNENTTQITLTTPDGEAGPQKIVFVIDISGSMSTEVVSSSGESDGYSVLDVVKHGIHSCIMSMRSKDKACIVVYSTNARVVFPLRTMDTTGKGLATVALAGISPENSTNIWSGLNIALKQLGSGGHIFLLTDGQPNIRPPRGEVHMLTSALDGRDDIILNTYGFGYNLDSELLFQLARTTQGSYSYIPDIGMVGTVFIHAIANLQTSVSQSLTLAIETTGTVEMPDIVKTSWGYFLPIGQITKGQARNIFVHCDQPVEVSILDVEIVTQADSEPGPDDSQIAAIGIFKCHQLAKADTKHAIECLDRLIGSIQTSSIVEDLNGQVREGILAYRKWGRHYLPSLALAYLTQKCNNFMDKGIQAYGGSTFQELRDSLDTMFNNLPAPKPSCRSRVEQAVPIRMSTYNTSAGPCFAGDCQVTLGDGTLTSCADIVKGDIVSTVSGTARVQCVIKTWCKDSSIKLVRLGTLSVTPWHPVKVNGQWDFPINHGQAVDTPCEAVYSYLLEQPHREGMMIEGWECITMAHNIENDKVATHPFYGTDKVIDNLKQSSGFETGQVELQAGDCLTMDAKTNLVCGLRFAQ